MCSPNGSLLREELGVTGFLPNYTLLGLEWGLWQEFVSTFPTYFDVGIFSVVHCVGVTHLVSEFLSEEIALLVGIYSVSGKREIQEPPVSPSWSRSYFK